METLFVILSKPKAGGDYNKAFGVYTTKKAADDTCSMMNENNQSSGTDIEIFYVVPFHRQ